MTDLTAREVVEKLHQYDLPSFPKINIHFLATAPGNEHLLKFMTEKPDNPIRFKDKRIGIIATHGVEETEVSIPRKWFEARGAICHLVSPNHIEYAPAFGIQFPEIAKTHVLAVHFTENSGWIPIDAHIEEATVEDWYLLCCFGSLKLSDNRIDKLRDVVNKAAGDYVLPIRPTSFLTAT